MTTIGISSAMICSGFSGAMRQSVVAKRAPVHDSQPGGPIRPARLGRAARTAAHHLQPTFRRDPMTDDRERWALILGASSGMGEATALALAAAGYRIAGIHLDFRAALAHVEEVKAGIVAAGSEALFVNMNAADDEKRAAALAGLGARFDESRAAGRKPYVR